MADDSEDLVSQVKIEGVDESTKQLEEFGDKGAEAFDKVAHAAAAAGVIVPKAAAGIEKSSKSAGDGVESLNQNLKAVKGEPTKAELNNIEKAARDLSSRAVKVSKDLAQFATRVTALATAGALAVAGIAKLGASIADQVNQTTSAFEKNNAAQQRAVAANLTAEQAAIQYASQQRVLNGQLARGTIDYDTYSTTLKQNQRAYQEQIRVTEQLKEAQESAREETEALQKAAADRKAFDDLTKTYGGPLLGALIGLGNAAIAAKNQFVTAFGPGAAAFVDTITTALESNASAISNFFSAAGAKISAFVSQNGPAIQQALASIGSAVAAIFDGLISALPSLLDFFNNQLVPAVRIVAGAIDSVVQGFNKFFGTNFSTGAAVIIVAITSITGGFKLMLGTLGLIQPGIIVLRALFTSMLGPIGLLVIAFTTLYFAIDWKAFGANAVAAGQAIMGFFAAIPGAITGFFGTIFTFVKDGWNALAQGVVSAWNGVVSFFSALPDTIGQIFTSIGDAISGAFVSAFDAVTAYVQSWVDPIKKFLQPIIDMINVIAGGASSDVGSASTPGFASGGAVRGPGTSTSDSILAWLSNNEFVMKAKAVRKYGTSFMRAINEGQIDPSRMLRFAAGGLVNAVAPRPVAMPSLAPSFSQARAAMSLSLSIGGEQFDNLVVTDEDTAGRLTRYAINKQSRSAGRRPSWSGGR